MQMCLLFPHSLHMFLPEGKNAIFIAIDSHSNKKDLFLLKYRQFFNVRY